MSYLDIVTAQLRIDEGTRVKPYKDQFGNITIGVGRNLTAVGLSDDEIEVLLSNDVNHAAVAAATVFPSFPALSDQRKAVLVNMAFNIGQQGLSEFTQFIALVEAQDWNGAADDMIRTRWATEVGPRATRLAQHMRDG